MICVVPGNTTGVIHHRSKSSMRYMDSPGGIMGCRDYVRCLSVTLDVTPSWSMFVS